MLRAGALALLLLTAAPARAAEPTFPPLAPGETPQATLVRSLDAEAELRFAARTAIVASIKDRAGLEARQRKVAATFTALLGGLPRERTPLAARTVGRLERPGFVVEKVIFDSFPGFHVTANLYLPTSGGGPFPAVLASMGHGEGGKAAERQGPDLARKGFVVLVPDPLGQGERLQHYDAELGTSRAGGPTEEHGQAAARAALVGDSVARLFVWDGMRAIDYLSARNEVDPARIGAMGCSGGGTVTTYLAALDARVKAAAIACYVTTWRALLAGPGPQEAEQSLHGFLAAGLDMADLLTLIAPRPLAVVSTIDDFFPLAGAEAAVEEVRRSYQLLGVPERISWTVAPGGHGNPRQGREAVTAFFQRYLQDKPGDPSEGEDARLDVETLACTETGQLATSLGGKLVADLVRERVPARGLTWPTAAPELAAARARLQAVLARTLGTIRTPGAPALPLTVHRRLPREGYRLEVVSLEGARGVGSQAPRRWGLLALPEAPGRKPATVILDARTRAEGAQPGSALGADLEARVRAGEIVLALEPRGTPTEGDPPARAGSLLGPQAALFRRASVLGHTLVGLWAEDVFAAVDALFARPDVDRGRIGGLATGSAGVAMLAAAALDPRIARLVVQDAPLSYRAVLAHSIHKNLPEVLVPGALLHYDLDDVIRALSPRPVTLLNPVDPVGRPLDVKARAAFARALPPPARVRVGLRVRREPLRWE